MVVQRVTMRGVKLICASYVIDPVPCFMYGSWFVCFTVCPYQSSRIHLHPANSWRFWFETSKERGEEVVRFCLTAGVFEFMLRSPTSDGLCYTQSCSYDSYTGKNTQLKYTPNAVNIYFCDVSETGGGSNNGGPKSSVLGLLMFHSNPRCQDNREVIKLQASIEMSKMDVAEAFH